MSAYVGLDVSLASTSVHVVDERGRCLWRGKCPTDLEALSSTIRRHAPEVERVGLETGMLATWLCHGLAERFTIKSHFSSASCSSGTRPV